MFPTRQMDERSDAPEVAEDQYHEWEDPQVTLTPFYITYACTCGAPAPRAAPSYPLTPAANAVLWPR